MPSAQFFSYPWRLLISLDFSRADLFLCQTPLEDALSIRLMTSGRSFLASSTFLAFISSLILRIAFFVRDFTLLLRSLLSSLCLALFLADLVRAIFHPSPWLC